ncbi:MAG: serine/threonine-protein kinase, partial [Thermoanaerobaculia bacterium]
MDDIEKKTEPVSFSEAFYGRIPEISERFCNFEYIDSGGFGDVYKARDKKLKQYVAIKIINKKRLAGQEDYERVIREVRTARELNHQNLLRYYEIYENERYIAIAMEYIDGITFEEKIKREGKFKEEEIKKYLPEITEAINYLHKKGIVHRDIKPSNLFITKEGNIKLGDFGIVFIEGEDKLTKTDQTLGTPTYMSPEQISGKGVSRETDWYSLGVMIYEMATGGAPFKGTKGEVIKGHLQERVPPLKGSKKLSKLIQGLTIKEKEKRWGYKEVKKYIEEKGLPFLPKEKKGIFISFISLILIVLSIIFIPKLLTPEPTSVEYKGKKLKVYSKKKLLFEKEMEKEISDAKITDIGFDRGKEIIIFYKIKPDYFKGKEDSDTTLLSDIYNSKGIKIFSPEIGNLFFYKNFSKFSLNYNNEIMPLIEIENGKVLPSRNFYFNVRHTFYPNIIHFYKNFTDPKNYYNIASEGFVQGICLWDKKLVAIGYANTFLHQCYIACLKDYRLGFDLGDNINIDTKNLLSLYFIGRRSLLTRTIEIIPDGENLRIKTPQEKEFVLEKDGNLLYFEKNTAEITVNLMENYAKIRNFINENEFEKAKGLISESIKKSKEYNLSGYTVLFISLRAEIDYMEGNLENAINLCLDSAKKYDGYGNDFYRKAAFFAYLNSYYDKAIEFWNWDPSFGDPGFYEKKTFQIFAFLLNENWKKAEELLGSEISQAVNIWNNYINYQKGVMYFLRKNLDEAVKILKPATEDLNMEDLATFYFLSKLCKGEPDVENFEKYIKNYPKGPLYLQFAGACTKGEWEQAKSIYFQMEKTSVHDPAVALIFPVIKKIIKIYP